MDARVERKRMKKLQKQKRIAKRLAKLLDLTETNNLILAGFTDGDTTGAPTSKRKNTVSITQKPRSVSRKIIFDFDDTLFPTLWYTTNKLRYTPSDLDKLMQPVAEEVCNLITYALEAFDHVVIITNAEEGWVQIILSTFPCFHKLHNIVDDNVPIFSARTKFSNKSSCPYMWKHYTFRALLQTFGKSPIDLTSIGDGPCERKAALDLLSDPEFAHIAQITSLTMVPCLLSPALFCRQLVYVRRAMQHLSKRNVPRRVLDMVISVTSPPKDTTATGA